MYDIKTELAKAKKIRKERAAAQTTESLATAQAALEHALEKYSALPCSRNAYAITEARERVEAAKTRETVTPRLMCAELRAEWGANGGI